MALRQLIQRFPRFFFVVLLAQRIPYAARSSKQSMAKGGKGEAKRAHSESVSFALGGLYCRGTCADQARPHTI